MQSPETFRQPEHGCHVTRGPLGSTLARGEAVYSADMLKAQAVFHIQAWVLDYAFVLMHVHVHVHVLAGSSCSNNIPWTDSFSGSSSCYSSSKCLLFAPVLSSWADALGVSIAVPSGGRRNNAGLRCQLPCEQSQALVQAAAAAAA